MYPGLRHHLGVSASTAPPQPHPVGIAAEARRKSSSPSALRDFVRAVASGIIMVVDRAMALPWPPCAVTLARSASMTFYTRGAFAEQAASGAHFERDPGKLLTTRVRVWSSTRRAAVLEASPGGYALVQSCTAAESCAAPLRRVYQREAGKSAMNRDETARRQKSLLTRLPENAQDAQNAQIRHRGAPRLCRVLPSDRGAWGALRAPHPTHRAFFSVLPRTPRGRAGTRGARLAGPPRCRRRRRRSDGGGRWCGRHRSRCRPG